ncbi:acyltransferase family protein [Thiocapsa rosea]|uniref:Peptidoglycan/LPS O-acetylase OafA/YrhL n=1 Tax=Thiocapsa rosea TaxID=69360 RepID=A0A495VC51_9GAMM|nr:acyltransferase family protein [Thiocapsa rosea]RKT46976.1 peptidoglycan/LPS O-acetylase OafA/YrhL [Thiocapsa rosea]
MIESHPYRADIDGLRALAIVPVVLFHADIPGFGGGFVGVDVFFVISGYLITSIIARELQTGRFSLARFYERRVRRILPALFAVLLASALAAALILYPGEARGFARSLIAATLFVSSIFFHRESGYFDQEAELKPLLHTWSLSVEEIFYILYPVLLWLIWSRGQRTRIALVGGIAALSFAASAIALRLDPASSAAFFLPHLRAWELLIGALVALAPLRLPRGRLASDLISVLGLVLIAWPVHAYSQDTVFPGLAALSPCLGAALLIVAGQRRTSLVGRGLSWRPIVLIGLISYSLYLWHWPIFVFARHQMGPDLSLGVSLLLVSASLILAILSWRFIERPFRGRSGVLPRPLLFGAATLAALILVGIGVHGDRTAGWLGRYPPELAVILAAADDRDPRQPTCESVRADTPGCLYGDPQAPPVIALFGDSHAATYATLLGELARERETSVLSLAMPICPPALGWQGEPLSWREDCERFQQLALERIIATPSIHTVVLSGRYRIYPFDDPDSGLIHAMDAAIDALFAAGKRVALVYPVPEPGADVPTVLAEAVLQGQDPEGVGQPLEPLAKDSRWVTAALDGLGAQVPLIRLHPHRILCPDGQCLFYRDGQVLYYDDNHLSVSGVRLLRPLFAPLFDHRDERAWQNGSR